MFEGVSIKFDADVGVIVGLGVSVGVGVGDGVGVGVGVADLTVIEMLARTRPFEPKVRSSTVPVPALQPYTVSLASGSGS